MCFWKVKTLLSNLAETVLSVKFKKENLETIRYIKQALLLQ